MRAILLFFLLAHGAQPDQAPPKTGGSAGTIEHVESPRGDDDLIQVRNGEALMSAGEDDEVYEGDHVITGPDQTVSITLGDESEIIVGPSSEFEVREAYTEEKKTTTLALAYGMLHALVNKIYSDDKPFVVETPAAVMGVRGTEFIVEHDAASGESQTHTLEGRVAMARSRADLRNPAAHSLLSAGMMSNYNRRMARPAAPRAFQREQLFKRLHARFVSHIRNRQAFRQRKRQRGRVRKVKARPRLRNGGGRRPAPRARWRRRN